MKISTINDAETAIIQLGHAIDVIASAPVEILHDLVLAHTASGMTLDAFDLLQLVKNQATNIQAKLETFRAKTAILPETIEVM